MLNSRNEIHSNIDLTNNFNKYFKCGLRNKIFLKEDLLKSHLIQRICVTNRSFKADKKVHQKENHYICPTCEKEFTAENVLKRHIKNVHDKAHDYPCHLCEKAFTESGSLKRHIVTIHDKKKPYPCNFCDKSFGQIATLNQHKVGIHKTGKISYICEICNVELHNGLFFSSFEQKFRNASKLVWEHCYHENKAKSKENN